MLPASDAIFIDPQLADQEELLREASEVGLALVSSAQMTGVQVVLPDATEQQTYTQELSTKAWAANLDSFHLDLIGAVACAGSCRLVTESPALLDPPVVEGLKQMGMEVEPVEDLKASIQIMRTMDDLL